MPKSQSDPQPQPAPEPPPQPEPQPDKPADMNDAARAEMERRPGA